MSDLGIIVAGAVGSYGSSNNANKTVRKIGSIVANITIEERHVDEMQISEHPIEQGAVITDHMVKRPEEVTLRVAWSNSVSAPGSLLGGIAGALQNTLNGTIQSVAIGGAAKAIGGSAVGNLAVSKLSNLLGASLTSYGSAVNTGTGKGTSKVQDVYSSLVQLMDSGEPFTLYTGKRTYTSMVIRSMVVETDAKTENTLVATLQCQRIIIVTTQLVSVKADPANQAAPQTTNPVAEEGTKQVSKTDDSQNASLQLALAKASYKKS